MEKYDPKSLEKKWPKVWDKNSLYATGDPKGGRKRYILDMFPYPSASGLHVGHMLGYVATDIVARYWRMSGHQVLHPMGWDAFGLPAENYAIKHGVHPDKSTHANIQNFKRQMAAGELSYDWEREIDTSSPDYYRWTQWLFIQLYEKGLAYRASAVVNWCPSCETVLANEQVVEGRCERCDTPVVLKEMEQWFLAITKYADRLLEGLDRIDWPASTKAMQRNWIGRKEGARVQFTIHNSQFTIKPEVFTTRLDTIFGVAFVVVAPEVARDWKTQGWKMPLDIGEYVKEALDRSEEERKKDNKQKTGVKTDLMAINPANGEKLPVYVADYVLKDVGTGVVMGVPAHDERDFQFAGKHSIDVLPVVLPQRVYVDENARNYYKGRQERNRKAIKELFELGNKNDKRLILSGGWAVAAQVGEEFRENEDIDLLILKEDVDWWRSQFVSLGYEVETLWPKGKNTKYYFQAIKDSSRGDIHVDISAIEVNEKGYIVKLESSNPEVLESRWADMVQERKLWGVGVLCLSRSAIYEEKKRSMTLKGEVRWKEQADFLMLGLEPYEGEGELINSGEYGGVHSVEARERMVKDGLGTREVTYHLRDWLISRQRYWGAPIPMIFCDICKWNPVPEDQLPVLLPTDVDFKPTGQSPITRSKSFQKDVVCPKCGGVGRREVDTMDTFVDSTWYFLRFCDSHNKKKIWDTKKVEEWMPVDLYVGGDHATTHLIYARFMTKVLFDLGLVKMDEPFAKFYKNGHVLGEDNRKMSKRWGNVVNPTEVVDKFGADTLRMYEMFMGPLDATKAWSTAGVEGVKRFLNRVWNLFGKTRDLRGEVGEADVIANKLVDRVTKDLETMSFNTAVAAMMESLNSLEVALKTGAGGNWADVWRKMALVMAPYAPYMAEELYQQLRGSADKFESVHNQKWPEFDTRLVGSRMVVLVVQVNGKMRGRIELESARAEELEYVIEEALKIGNVAKHVIGTKYGIVFVPGKILNLVTNGS